MKGTNHQMLNTLPEQAFETLGESPKAVTCPAIDGIITEANEIAGDWGVRADIAGLGSFVFELENL